MAGCCGKHEKDGYADMERELKAYCADRDARIGVAVIVDGHDTVMVNGRGVFPMMSVFKFPLALAVGQWIESQGASLGDSVFVKAGDLHEDTYSPMLKKYGRKDMALTYRELLEWALMESDNNATDILINQIGGIKDVNHILKQLDVPGEISIGASEDDMHRDNSLSYLNLSTPLAMAELFDRFNSSMRGESAAFEEIASMIERCGTGQNRLPKPLAEADAVIGRKTGTGFATADGRLTAVNDCGYVNLPDGRRYSIAVFVADTPYDMDEAEGVIAEISRIVYNHLAE